MTGVQTCALPIFPCRVDSIPSFLVHLLLTRYGNIVHTLSLLIHPTSPFPRPLFPRLVPPVKRKPIDVAAQDPRPYSPSLSLLSIPHIANSPPTHYCQLIPPDWTAPRFQHSHYHYHQFILFDVQRTVGSPQSLCIHTGYFTTHCDVFTVTTAYSYPTLSTPAASQSARGI